MSYYDDPYDNPKHDLRLEREADNIASDYAEMAEFLAKVMTDNYELSKLFIKFVYANRDDRDGRAVMFCEQLWDQCIPHVYRKAEWNIDNP